MPDDRRGPLVVGALTVFMGALLFLAAGDVIPQPDKAFGAPRWLVALFGLAFFFGGWYAISLALPTPRMRQVLAAAAGLAFLSGGALLFTWLALTSGGSGPPSMSIRPGSSGLPPNAGALIVRAFFWLFALPADAIAIVAWIVALRWLVRRPPP